MFERLNKNLSDELREFNDLFINMSWQSVDYNLPVFRNGLNLDYLTKEQRKFFNLLLNNFFEWKKIIGRKQHLTHDYTLDIHMLCVVQKIRADERYQKLTEINRLKILYLAILHDIEKLENTVDPQHPVNSAQTVLKVLYRLGFEEFFINDVCNLIKNHQILGLMAADRINFSEKEIVETFKNIELFELFMIFSKADIQSVKKDGLFYTPIIDEKSEYFKNHILQILNKNDAPD